MKRTAKMTFVLAIGIFVLIAAGCEEEKTSVVRKGRLVVLENEKIKKELESCQKENQQQKELLEKEFEKKRNDLEDKIEKQKEQFEKELEKQGGNLENCRNQKKILEGTTEKYMQKQVDSVLKVVMDENVRLRQENEGLKAEIEQLKAEKDK